MFAAEDSVIYPVDWGGIHCVWEDFVGIRDWGVLVDARRVYEAWPMSRGGLSRGGRDL